MGKTLWTPPETILHDLIGVKVDSYYSVVNIYNVVTSFSSPTKTLPGINSSYM